MRTTEGKKRKLTLLGYVISIGGMLLAVFLYFFLGIGDYFADLSGTFGLSETIWTFIGGIILLFVIMAILTPIVLKVGTKTE